MIMSIISKIACNESYYNVDVLQCLLQEKTVAITPHDYKNGGVHCVTFSEDSQHIFTTGFDGVLACFNWK